MGPLTEPENVCLMPSALCIVKTGLFTKIVVKRPVFTGDILQFFLRNKFRIEVDCREKNQKLVLSWRFDQ